MIEWLQIGGGQVGIYDGNNLTEERRSEIYEKLTDLDIHVKLPYMSFIIHCLTVTCLGLIY